MCLVLCADVYQEQQEVFEREAGSRYILLLIEYTNSSNNTSIIHLFGTYRLFYLCYSQGIYILDFSFTWTSATLCKCANKTKYFLSVISTKRFHLSTWLGVVLNILVIQSTKNVFSASYDDGSSVSSYFVIHRGMTICCVDNVSTLFFRRI